MPIFENIPDMLRRLTVEEKAALTSGSSFWTTTPVDRVGVPAILLTDGPHGVRKQAGSGDHLGLTESVPATCFPPAVALASSWDRDLVHRVGDALGEEARAEGVHVLLGPGINIKRSPLCGRNFEYLSEDPCLTGELGSALITGIQGHGVAASLKHFAANNQETDRLRISADLDERTLREIYLRAFRQVVTQARPWTVMCSYNRINGVYASQNRWLLTTVLREEWGYDGLVVSDWGAVVDGSAALAAGLDLEMPARAGADTQILDAVQAGRVSQAALDTAASRVLTLIDKTAAAGPASYDVDAHHLLAREAAARCAVLLKNEGDLLPLETDAQIAVIGEFARTPRYQGSGSSQIVPTRLDAALDEIRALALGDVAFAPGYQLSDATAGTDPSDGGMTGDRASTPALHSTVSDDPEETDEAPRGAAAASEEERLRDEAVRVARDAEVVLLFLGLPGSEESEGFDREHLELPAVQSALLDAVLAVNSTVVVVLANGGVVRVSGWDERVPAILEGWLLGQAGGGAIADILFGRAEPGGRLAETIPVRLQDTPAYLGFPGEGHHARYGEGIFVGYRWYDARDLPVSYPFGHGLGYTRFDYEDCRVAQDAEGRIVAEATVRNIGQRAGREVLQVYVGQPDTVAVRAPRELRGFAVLDLEAGESRRASVEIARDDLAHFDLTAGWVVAGGDYEVALGSSSRDLHHVARITVEGEEPPAPTADSTVAEWLADPVGADLLTDALGGAEGLTRLLGEDPNLRRMLEAIPLSRVAAFPGSPLAGDAIPGLAAAAKERRAARAAGPEA